MLAYLLSKAEETRMRMIILDIRARIQILRTLNPSVRGDYETIFNRELKGFDPILRDKIVKFTQRHDYDLQHLMTTKQMEKYDEVQKKNPGVIPE